MTHFTDSEIRQWSRSGPGEDRERVVAHLASCVVCADAYAEAIRAQSFTPESAAPADARDVDDFVKIGYAVPSGRATSAPSWNSRLRTYTGLAAAAVLIAAIAVPYFVQRRDRDRVDASYRGAGVQALAPAGTVDPGTEFEWSTTVAASSYRVEVGDATGVVSSATAGGTHVRLLPEAWQKLTPGVDYWWTVTALDANGRDIAATERQAFRIRPQ